MNKEFIFRRLIQLVGIELLLYWGLDYIIDWKFWTATLCFVSVTSIWILIHELETKDTIKKKNE